MIKERIFLTEGMRTRSDSARQTEFDWTISSRNFQSWKRRFRYSNSLLAVFENSRKWVTEIKSFFTFASPSPEVFSFSLASMSRLPSFPIYYLSLIFALRLNALELLRFFEKNFLSKVEIQLQVQTEKLTILIIYYFLKLQIAMLKRKIAHLEEDVSRVKKENQKMVAELQRARNVRVFRVSRAYYR